MPGALDNFFQKSLGRGLSVLRLPEGVLEAPALFA
jgi:hypothetical protein